MIRYVFDRITQHRLDKSIFFRRRDTNVDSIEMFHEQLPLPVPCYDLLPVIELTVDHREDELRVFPTPLS